jgi:hypothetical protein
MCGSVTCLDRPGRLRLESSERAGDYEGLPVWRAQCGGGASYSIVITSGGVAQILDEAEVQLVGNSAEPVGNAQ